MKKILRNSFFMFLIFYFFFNLYHAYHEISIWLFFGVVIAIFAHGKKNSVSLILLLGHMSIEWFEWGKQAMIFGLFMLNILHAIMDFVFLNHEVRVHIKTILNPILVLSFVFFILAYIFIASSSIHVNEEIMEILHKFTLGGLVGCLGSHIVFHLTKEK